MEQHEQEWEKVKQAEQQHFKNKDKSPAADYEKFTPSKYHGTIGTAPTSQPPRRPPPSHGDFGHKFVVPAPPSLNYQPNGNRRFFDGDYNRKCVTKKKCSMSDTI